MTGPRESGTPDPSGLPNCVFLIGSPILAGVLAHAGCMLIMRFFVGYTGDDAINGLSPANFWYAMKAGWVATAISVTVTLATFVLLPANRKHLSLLFALSAPAVCGFVFFWHIVSGLG